MELAASEALVSSPVAMAFDENGRLFVAEQRDYPNQQEKTPHLGRIRLVEDTDGDGYADRSTVWATVVVVALILVAILAYGSCYSRP